MPRYQLTPLPKTIGFGTMGITFFGTKITTQEEANHILLTAYKAGARFFNGGEFYGPDCNNLKVLHEFFQAYPELKKDIIVSIKGATNVQTFQPEASREGVRRSLDNILSFLPETDIFEAARTDPKVPIEETISAIDEYVKDGKINAISLSEAGAETIRRAAKVAPISFVETELSLWSRDILYNGVLDTCKELGIPVVAYSPLGSGFFTGNIRSINDLPETDFRRLHLDRFSTDEIIKQNGVLLEKLEKIAKQENLSLPQLSLAWIGFFNDDANPNKNRYPDIIPLPGSTKTDRIVDNANIRKISLQTYQKIEKVLEDIKVAGERFNEQNRALLSL